MKLLLLFCIFFNLVLCTHSIFFNLPQNLVEAARGLGASKLLQYATTAGLVQTLSSNGPFTIFAPTDQAFDALPKAVKDAISTDTGLLKTVLLTHVTPGGYLSSQLSNEVLLPTLNTDTKIRINIYQSRNVITVSGSRVVLANQNVSNGIIHVIDRVIYPLPSKSLLEYVGTSPDLSDLLYSVVQANLVDTFKGNGPFTLFAPTTKAFDELPAGQLSDLLSTNYTQFVDLLKYHVIVGQTVYSKGLKDGPITMLDDKDANMIVHANGGVKINSANVITADQSVSNGVVHIIDKVLIPQHS